MISSSHVLFDHIQFKQNAFETYERVYYNLLFSTKASCGSSFQNFKAQCTVKYLVAERASNSQGSSRIFKSHCDQPEPDQNTSNYIRLWVGSPFPHRHSLPTMEATGSFQRYLFSDGHRVLFWIH